MSTLKQTFSTAVGHGSSLILLINRQIIFTKIIDLMHDDRKLMLYLNITVRLLAAISTARGLAFPAHL